MDGEYARQRRAIIRQTTNRTDSALQVQIIYLFGLVFTLLISPFPVALGGFVLMQLSELYSLVVFRAVFKAAQDPYARLDHLKAPLMRQAIILPVVGIISLFMVYVTTPDGWNLGVLAGSGLAAVYFVPFGRHNAVLLYGSLGAFLLTLFIAVFTRAYLMDDFSAEVFGAPFSLTLFLTVTTFAVAVNARVEYFKRLDDEELIDHAFSELRAENRAKSVLLAQISHEIRCSGSDVI